MRPKLLFFILIACVGCKSTQHGTSNEEPTDVNGGLPTPSISTQEYIKLYAPISIAEMNRSSIPASITLAQAILESGAGKSYLSVNARNHFGIKCGPHWRGETLYKKDDEKNASCFRKYDQAEESFRDHSTFLTDPKKEHRYGFLFNLAMSDYKGWAKGLQKSGYATNNEYADLLIRIIEKYALTDYDIPTIGDSEFTVKVDAPMILHIVNTGDTLYSVSKKYDVSVDIIMATNKLESDIIQPGQKLIIPQ